MRKLFFAVQFFSVFICLSQLAAAPALADKKPADTEQIKQLVQRLESDTDRGVLIKDLKTLIQVSENEAQEFMVIKAFSGVRNFAKNVLKEIINTFKNITTADFWSLPLDYEELEKAFEEWVQPVIMVLLIAFLGQFTFALLLRSPMPPFYKKLTKSFNTTEVLKTLFPSIAFFAVGWGASRFLSHEEAVHSYNHEVLLLVLALQVFLLALRVLLVSNILPTSEKSQKQAFRFASFVIIVYFFYTHTSQIIASDDELAVIHADVSKIFWGIIAILLSVFVAMSRDLLEDLLFKGHITSSHREASALEKGISKGIHYLIIGSIIFAYCAWLIKDKDIFHYIRQQLSLTLITLFLLNLISFFITNAAHTFKAKKNQESIELTISKMVSTLTLLACFYIMFSWVKPLFAMYGYNGEEFSEKFLDVFIIVALAGLGIYGVNRLSEKQLSSPNATKHMKTFIPITEQIARILILFAAGVLILIEVGVNITPIIASFSVIGLGIGLGSKSIIQDFLSGLFTIHENDFNIGDKIRVSDIEGIIENLTLRKLHIRDLEGGLHYLPFGSITNVTNLSKEYNQVFVTIPLPEKFHLQRTAQILEDIGKEMTKNEKFASKILTSPKFLGVKEFFVIDQSPFSIPIMTFSIRCVPTFDRLVACEFRKLAHIAFEEMGMLRKA